MTHLLHECIAHQRSLDVRLDSFLSSCPDLNRGLLVLCRSSSPLLSLAHSDSFLLLSFLCFTASLADQVSFTLTDVGTMTRLLHECIAHHHSLDVLLDSLLSSHPDLNRTSSHSVAPPRTLSLLLALCRSSSPLLSLARSDLSLLLSFLFSTVSLADQVSSRIRQLDLTRRSSDVKDYDSITASRICYPLGFPKG